MLAVDTNVVVRYLVGDDPDQSSRARTLIGSAKIWVSTTVLLETAWVLGTTYGYGPDQVAWSLRLFAGLPTVTVENPDKVARALSWFPRLDIPDALHLSLADEAEAFVTFDKRLTKGAAAIGFGTVRTP